MSSLSFSKDLLDFNYGLRINFLCDESMELLQAGKHVVLKACEQARYEHVGNGKEK